jgi:hypothetical protein
MRRALLVLALALAAAASAAPAQAYVVGGRPWPGATVTYYSAASAYSGAVDRAARMINRAGVGVRLRRASRLNADVTVVYGGARCAGAAFVGFQRLREDTLLLGRGCSRGLVTLTAVHEFGHVLGLDHENRACARMNPTFDGSGTPTHCAERRLSWWLAHPLTRDDLRGLRRLYGS